MKPDNKATRGTTWPIPVGTLPSEQGLKRITSAFLSFQTSPRWDSSIRTRIETRFQDRRRVCLFTRWDSSIRTRIETLQRWQCVASTSGTRWDSSIRTRIETPMIPVKGIIVEVPVGTLPSEQGLKHESLLTTYYVLIARWDSSIRTRIETGWGQRRSGIRCFPVGTLPSEQGLKPGSTDLPICVYCCPLGLFHQNKD